MKKESPLKRYEVEGLPGLDPIPEVEKQAKMEEFEKWVEENKEETTEPETEKAGEVQE